MDVSRYLKPAFIRYQDVVGAPRTERIVAVQDGNFDCLDLKFESGDSLSLNQTNLKTLVLAYGKDTDNWIDKDLELYGGETQFNGEVKQSVLIKPISPSKSLDVKPSPDDDIPF
jgi:hypothetical protein